jgi:hypothetical protein
MPTAPTSVKPVTTMAEAESGRPYTACSAGPTKLWMAACPAVRKKKKAKHIHNTGSLRKASGCGGGGMTVLSEGPAAKAAGVFPETPSAERFCVNLVAANVVRSSRAPRCNSTSSHTAPASKAAPT